MPAGERRHGERLAVAFSNVIHTFAKRLSDECSGLPIPLDDLKVALRVEHDREDDYICRLEWQAIGYVERHTSKYWASKPGPAVAPLPGDIRAAIVRIVTSWYEHRSPVQDGSTAAVPLDVDSTLKARRKHRAA